MASKKLRLEVELETAKAKRQAKKLEQTSGGGGAPAATTPVSSASSRAARQISELGNAAQGARVNMKEVTRAFTGMAVGMAANYAAKSMKPGAARDAVEYGGSAMTGAAMGMVAGPIGMAVGALGGIIKTYLDKSGESKMAIEDFRKSEDQYEDSRLFAAKMRNLSEVESSAVGMTKKEENADQSKKVEERLQKVKEEAVKLFEEQNKIAKEINALLKDGKNTEAEAKKERLSIVRQRKEEMESLERSYEKQKKSLAREAEQIAYDEAHTLKPSTRTSLSGTDALAKLGAGAASIPSGGGGALAATRSGYNFGFAVPAVSRKFSTMSFGTPSGDANDRAIKAATERSARLDEEMAKTLKAIEENTKGGEAWQ